MAQRELTPDEVDALLRSQRVMRVAFSTPDRIYILPLGYLWMDQQFHLIVTSGDKMHITARNPRVGFQIDDSAEMGLLAWSSVSGEGEWEVVSDRTARESLLPLLLDRFPELRDWGTREHSDKEAAGEVHYVRIRPTQMTGRHFVPD
ncbi:MAG TPA: pyridoxamine 5'-phosphate oxidase family protein [Thermoanaerobaculia bacterium]|nr:pyridoxamine 5'-phosphate oxidase family protein [Thermoanaerobaculia bacterium]